MRYIAVQLTALSPLAIRADHSPGSVATARYIAGSTLMGSLAAAHRLFHDDDERTPDFEQLFLREQVLYPNLSPATFGGRPQKGVVEWWNRSETPVYPLPLTARTCKRSPGFLFVATNDTREPGHGVRDSLFDWTIFKLALARGEPLSAKVLELIKQQQKCPRSECKRATKTFLEYYRRNELMSSRPMIGARATTRVQAHTGINRETGTVQEGILYSREVFKEQTRFWGLLKAPDELETTLRDFLKEVGESGLLRVGSDRSRGLGKVQLDAYPLKEQPYGYAAFKKRLEDFHTAFSRQAASADLALEPEHFTFALTLHSPAILRDELLRYRQSISETVLSELLRFPTDPFEVPADSFQAIYQATESRRVAGWNEVWGTPRFQELAIETGSVFFFASCIGANEDLLRALYRLEQEGIGQRRAEGFGRVCISDPFHLEVTLR
jgi:CRISPR-associated protein Csx10